MAIQYVKHDRVITQKQIDEYGQLATHDIMTEAALLAVGMKVPNTSGDELSVDLDMLKRIKNATNGWIRHRFDNPLVKARSYVFGLDKNEFIPFIKNHDLKDNDGKIGSNVGMFYIRKIDGIPTLCVKMVITSLAAKSSIDGVDGKNMISNVSIQTRPDASIREISAVINEGAPGAGLLLNEPGYQPEPNPVVNLELQLAEVDSTIEKHTIIAHMIKTAKTSPYLYDELMLSDVGVLVRMNRGLPARELGLTLGTSKIPQPVEKTDMSKINDYLRSVGKEPIENMDEAVKHSPANSMQLEERETELTRVLELVRVNPHHAEKYLQFELDGKCDDKYLPDNTRRSLLDKRKDLTSQILILQEQN